MCEILNEYFANVFTKEDIVEELPEVKTRFQNDESCMLNDVELSPDIVLNKLTKLKLTKAPGLDGIVPRLLVENADVL